MCDKVDHPPAARPRTGARWVGQVGDVVDETLQLNEQFGAEGGRAAAARPASRNCSTTNSPPDPLTTFGRAPILGEDATHALLLDSVQHESGEMSVDLLGSQEPRPTKLAPTFRPGRARPGTGRTSR